MSLKNPSVGEYYTPAYQMSGIPFVTSSIVNLGQIKEVVFSHVSKFVTIKNHSVSANTLALSFTSNGLAVAWTGNRWVATGYGTVNTVAYSSNGINWTGLGVGIFTGIGFGVAWNAGLGSVDISGNSIILDKYGSAGSDTLDIVSSPYYNQGFTNLSIVIKP